MERKVGQVVFSDRGYLITEVLDGDGAGVIGFSLLGPHASDAIIYGSRMQALEALRDIETWHSGR